MRAIAVIGTAGRDKAKPMTRQLWAAMVRDLRARVARDDQLISGGAAWADHLAVAMFLEGAVGRLCLHLSAPFENGRFFGPRGQSAAGAANYYHDLFKRATGVDGLAQIAEAIERGAMVTSQPPIHGYSGMFARNKLVAQSCNMVIAYTFGEGDEPADGGTKNTWDQVQGERVHVSLGRLLEA